MPDREKVIEALKIHLSADDLVVCDDCTYSGDEWCLTRMLTDVIALLEQEPVSPIKKAPVEITARYGYDCPCGAPLLIGQPYCANCGKAVNWIINGDDWFCADGERKNEDD